MLFRSGRQPGSHRQALITKKEHGLRVRASSLSLMNHCMHLFGIKYSVSVTCLGKNAYYLSPCIDVNMFYIPEDINKLHPDPA